MNKNNLSLAAAETSSGGFTARRVVTGHDENGKSIILSDGTPPNIFSTPALPGYISFDMFRTFESPAVIVTQTTETTDGPRRQLPTPSGTVIRISQFPPTNEAMKKLNTDAELAAFKALGNSKGHTGSAGAKHALMHRTETIDYVVVLSGELTLVLDDSEVVLRGGDVLVQCGTNHTWENRTDTPATVMFMLISGAYNQALAEIISSES